MSTIGNWSQLEDMPAQVQEIYPTTWNGEIAVAGGLRGSDDGTITITDESWIFDPITSQWESAERLPSPRHHAHLAVAGDYLYVAGGFSGDRNDGLWVMQSECWRRSINGKWESIRPLPNPQAEGIFFSHDGRLHYFGGRSPKGSANGSYNNHKDVTDHWTFEPGSRQWDTAAPTLYPRNSTAAVKIDSKVYNFGGRDVQMSNKDKTEVYHIDEDRWEELEPMPQAQAGIAAGLIDGQIVVFGGEGGNTANPDSVFREVWIYDPTANTWSRGPEMNAPRHGLGGVTIDNVVYACGGASKMNAVQTTAIVEKLSIA